MPAETVWTVPGDPDDAVPTSTYRLQIRASFTLADAANVAGYLRDLGVGAIYLSPILRATSGSDHGYDATDPRQIDPARGGEEGWRRLLGAAGEHGLGIVVDIVPNHVGIAAADENPAWWDVLQYGADSAYANWFDVDWSRRIVIPILGDDATLELRDGELGYYEHRFPLAPGTWTEGDDADAVHARQHYELVHHARGNRELNYRRFFAVTTLAGVRVEDAESSTRPTSASPASSTKASTGCGSTIRTAWWTLPDIWTGARAGAAAVDHGGEDPRAR